VATAHGRALQDGRTSVGCTRTPCLWGRSLGWESSELKSPTSTAVAHLLHGWLTWEASSMPFAGQGLPTAGDASCAPRATQHHAEHHQPLETRRQVTGAAPRQPKQSAAVGPKASCHHPATAAPAASPALPLSRTGRSPCPPPRSPPWPPPSWRRARRRRRQARHHQPRGQRHRRGRLQTGEG